MPPKYLRKLDKKPAHRRKSPHPIACFVNLSVSARDERFEIATRLRLGRKSRDFREIGGNFFVKKMKTPRVFDTHALRGFVGEFVEHRFEFGPNRTRVLDEARKVDNHVSIAGCGT